MLACQRYIELNPVRAGTVAHLGEYPWSSYRAYGAGEENALIRPHRLFEALRLEATIPQPAYRELFRHELEPGLVNRIRQATSGKWQLCTGQRTIRDGAGSGEWTADVAGQVRATTQGGRA